MLARCLRKRSYIAMRSPTAEVDLHGHPDPQGQNTCQVVEIVALDFDIVNRPTLAIGSHDLGVLEEPPEVCMHRPAFIRQLRWIIVGHSNLVGRAALGVRQARHKHENRKPLFHFLHLWLSVFGWTPRGLFPHISKNYPLLSSSSVPVSR